jgi:O-phosphoseryl-tRNA synthetase
MVKLNPNEILKRVEKEGFEKVWTESAKLIPVRKKGVSRAAIKPGTPHPIFDLAQKLRQSFINLGFTEILNPIIIDETEIYKQYGPEAAIILDRCYYLASFPRPDIGLGKDKCAELEKLGIALTPEKIDCLQTVLRNYKKGELASDDLVESVAESLEISDTNATVVIEKVFPEFATLKPQPSTLTLRSHMTSAWFGTLKALQHKTELPIKLFSIDVKFRREQQEDPTHLRSSFVASCVIMDEEPVVEDGEEITKALLQPLGFKQFNFVQKKITSRYYTPGTEYEGFVYFPAMKRWVEIVNYGIYNPIALAKYGLEYPVLNAGIGVERVAMLLQNETDIRRLAYPYSYAEWGLSDVQIAEMIQIVQQPKTPEGKKLLEAIIKTALLHVNEPSPCEYSAFKGKVFGRTVEVSVYEPDAGTKLLGPAALNTIYVYDGNILGIPATGFEEKPLVRVAREKGISTRIRYLDAIAALAASEIEEAARKGGPKEVSVRVRMAKNLGDINLKISEIAMRYITGKGKNIIVGGPVFIGTKATIGR